MKIAIHTEDLTKVYPGTDFAAVDKGFGLVFLTVGLRNFRRRVLS